MNLEELRQAMASDANRCWVLTRGSMCCFCNLSTFECSHDTMSYEQKLEAAKKMMKEEE